MKIFDLKILEDIAKKVEDNKLLKDYMDNLGKIEMKFGTNSTSKVKGVETLVIHPDYYQYTGDTVVGHTDVALLKVSEDIFTLNNRQNQTDQYPWIVPICLPPKLNYKPDVNQTAEGIHEPFEDMDCHLIPGI